MRQDQDFSDLSTEGEQFTSEEELDLIRREQPRDVLPLIPRWGTRLEMPFLSDDR
jgi:hypothetical protein